MSDVPAGPWTKYQQAPAADAEGPWTKYQQAAQTPPESAIPDAGRFGMTAVTGGLGALADFAMDPLSPLRHLISPGLERLEKSGKFQPGKEAAGAIHSATGVPEYEPTTPAGRVGMAASQGLVAGGPFGVVPGALSALGGALSQGTAEAATGSFSPDNVERLSTAAGFLPMGAAPAARGATNYATGLAKRTFGPALSEPYREGIVGDRLRAGASDPEAFAQSLLQPRVPELVPGSKPTTYQYTGDPGIGQLERGRRTLDATPFLERMQEQSGARASGVQGLAPEGANPAAVRDVLRQNLARLDQEGESNIRAAQQNATQAFDQAGGKLNPEEYGALMRDQLEAAKAATKQREGTLWRAIDPEGKLSINGLSVREEANKILSELPKTARQPEGEEAAVFGHARLLGTAAPFQDFTALRGRLLQAIREERANGQTPALRRMQILRESMDDAISNVAENAAQSDAGLFGRVSADFERVEAVARTEAEARAGRDSEARSYVVPGAPASATAGVRGAVRQETGGPRGAAGDQGVPEPPRPQDLVSFLLSRGGLKDEGGELRALDFHKVNKGHFGRLSRKDGMPLDDARELAVENGFLHPDADINDFLGALRRNQEGNPIFSEGAPDAAAWLEYDRRRRRGEFEIPLPGEDFAPAMPSAPRAPLATFDEAAASRYRAAADATRDRAARFNNQIVGPTLAERGSEYRLRESQVPERFLSSPEGVKAFMDAGGSPQTLRDTLVSDLRRSATAPDGSLNPVKYQSWLNRRAAAVRSFPEVEQTFGNVARAQETVDAVSAAARQSKMGFESGAARHFLNAEPAQAVQAALNGKNPVGDMGQVVRMVVGDADAKAGLQRAVAEYIERQFIGNADAMKSDAFQTFIKRSGPALSKVFDPAQMQAMRDIAADLKRSNLSIAGSKIPGQSNSLQDLHLTKDRMSVLRGYIGPGAAAAAGGLAAYLMPGGLGVLEAAVGAGGAKRVLDNIKAAGIEKTDKLMTEALLNPNLAQALLMKANNANRPFIEAKLRATLGRLLGAGAASETEKPKREAR